jgi:hypothetical protein
MASSIGIKLANGDFYSLVEENSAAKRRLVLTTVHDKQRSVQIDLYRSFIKTMADAQYIGSLVVENIKPRPKGEPSIEMVISAAIDGEITAEAADLDASGGQRQSLNVSLKSLEEDSRDLELPDFDLEAQEPPPQGLYEKAEAVREKKSRSFPLPLLIILILVLLIGGGFAVWYFVFGAPLPSFFGGGSPSGTAAVQPAEPAPVQTSPVKPASEPVKPVEAVKVEEPARQPVQVIQAPAPPAAEEPPKTPAPVNRTRPVPPVASYKVPATIPRGGVAYRIRWGDTLWDISEAFYRNPWLYPRIARFNNIRNPDLIISGRTIRIPPRN